MDQNNPKFNKWFVIIEKIFIPSGLLVFVLGLFSLQNYSIKIFVVLYILSLPFYLISIIYLGTRKRKINRIMLSGTLLAVIIARSAAIQHYFSGEQNFQLINFEYIIAAVVILFLFLNLGLLYKSKLVYIQKVQLEVQRLTELSSQRSMISADLHDDLGASLSSIHLNATMAHKSLQKDLTQSEKSLRKIITDLKSVIQNMGDIIWAINPDRQTQKSISGQLKDFYFEIMDDHNIQCNYHIDNNVESEVTNIIARKNLLLISKEAINNILKHAQASKIDISMEEQNDQLVLKIQDNGVGIADYENNVKGNGLRNMRFRAEKIFGKLIIKSEVGVGTIIFCSVPITNIRYIPTTSI